MSKDTFKILVVGASGVGKTTLLEQIVKYKPKKDTVKTIGVKFYLHEVLIDDKKYTLQFWDFIENERFEFLYKDYFRGANAAIIIFDWSRIETFYSAQRYLRLIRKFTKSNISFIIVGNKIDLVDDLEWFDRSSIRELFDEEGGFYIECSMKNTEKFEKAIVELIQRIGELELIEVTGKDINLKIILALNIFPELTLNKLASLTNKSKPTISRYTRSLIRLGLIKSYSKEEEKQPGSIKKKYYTLSYDIDFHSGKFDIKRFDIESGKDSKALALKLQRKFYLLLIYEQFGKILNNFIDKFSGREYFPRLILSSFRAKSLLPPFKEKSELYYRMINLILDVSMNVRFLNENQHNKLESLKREFYLKFNKILEEDDGSKKSYVYIDAVLPILQLMELEGAKYKKDSDAVKKLTDQIDKLQQQRKKKDQ